jgi:16S rRNA (guanine527-N7)-methyltransferase
MHRRLRAGAEALGVSLDEDACARFVAYWRLLERWNARINLTRITDEEEVIDKHFLDSLALVPHLAPGAVSLVDVGAGAGFPGIPCAIARPSLRVTLVEATQKKCAFLEAVKRELSLPLTVRAIRLEELVRGGERYDVVVSRAMLAPPEWIARGAELVAPGGLLVAMLGRDRPPLPTPSGFGAPVLAPYHLPEGERALALLHRSNAAAP